jgi:uncharacterized membrane protein
MRVFTLLLLMVVSACGAQESGSGDPAVSEEELAKNNVWHKAKLRGVAFRAIGQEPGWLLEITNGEEILLVTDYGQNRKSHPYVEPQEDKAARRTVFQVDADTSVLIEGKPCSDTMAARCFEWSLRAQSGP